MERLPNVAGATASVGVPVIGGSRASLAIFRRSGDQARGEVAYMSIAPGFIDLWRIRLVAGRDFTSTDDERAPSAIVINETMARRHWPDGDALGARIWIGPEAPEDPAQWMTVTGIIEDVRQHGPPTLSCPRPSALRTSIRGRAAGSPFSPVTRQLPLAVRTCAARCTRSTRAFPSPRSALSTK
ncbi:MAG: ABC transporter permease [Longimicrobiales bacterium]